MPDWDSYAQTSIHGRRMGLQSFTTAQSGGSRGMAEFIVGPEALRYPTTTNQTTAQNVKAWGVTMLPGTSVGSSAVYVIDPPIPGVRSTIQFSTLNGPIHLRTVGGEVFQTTNPSTAATTLNCSSNGGVVDLIGLTTAMYGVPGCLPTTVTVTTST